jgi:hypothetical protein
MKGEKMKKSIKHKQQNLAPSYVYNLLPKTNCKECGEETCKKFAEKVTKNQRHIEECPPLLKKRIQNYKKERKKLLKELKIENKIMKKEETFVQSKNYGEAITRIKTKKAESTKYIIITTNGLVLKDQTIYQLKKKWQTLNNTQNAQSLKKFIDYNKQENFTGLIPFKTNSSKTISTDSPFPFDVKIIQEKHLLDNPWITELTGYKGSLLIGFLKDQTEPRVYEFPLNKQTQKSINEFTELITYVKYQYEKNEKLGSEVIKTNIKRRFNKKHQLEEAIKIYEKNLDKHQIDYPKQQNSVNSPKESKTKKSKRKLVLWDTSHYETLRFESFVKELIELIKETTNLEIQWLKGNWSDQLLLNKKLLEKTKILVLSGLESSNKISKKEINAIKNYIKEGGTLFLTGPSFKGEDTNVITSNFGVKFEWTKITDEDHHESKYTDHVIISNFHDHEITKNVEQFCFGDYGGFPLIPNENVISLAKTSQTSKPSKATVLAHKQYGKGVVIFASSSTTFKDKYLKMFDNKKLAENIFRYLSSSIEPEEHPTVKPKKEKTIKISSKPPKSPEERKPTITITKEVKEPQVKQTEIKQITETKVEKIEPEATIESTTSPEIPKNIEDKIDKLDERLIFGIIDELTYEIEKIKIENNLQSLNQLINDKKIKLSQYLEIQRNIRVKIPNNTCSSCGENLIGLEKFCPNCGEKTK